MAFSLSAEAQRLLEERVRAGGYSSTDAVVYAALDALDQLESAIPGDETLEAIDRAEEQIERGEIHDWSAVREQVRARFLKK